MWIRHGRERKRERVRVCGCEPETERAREGEGNNERERESNGVRQQDIKYQHVAVNPMSRNYLSKIPN